MHQCQGEEKNEIMSYNNLSGVSSGNAETQPNAFYSNDPLVSRLPHKRQHFSLMDRSVNSKSI